MRYLGIAVLYVLGLVLQSTLFNFLKVGGVKPDLVLLLVIYFAFTNGPVKGALLGLGLGLLEDFFIGYYFGMNALALLVSGFVAGWFETVMYKENIFIALFVTFFGSLIAQTVTIFSGITAGLGWQLADSWNTALKIAIYNVCLVPFTYPFFHKTITKGWLRYRPRHEE